MELKVTTKQDDGPIRTYVGEGVCTGPGVFRLVLTWPYDRGGRIVEIPLTEVESVVPVEPRALGDEPAGQSTW